MATTQQTPISKTRPGSRHRQDIAPTYEPGSVHHHDERVTEQTEDMHWAIDVLSPTSDSCVWEKYVANGMLVVLAQEGATTHIKQLSATVLSNSARVVS